MHLLKRNGLQKYNLATIIFFHYTTYNLNLYKKTHFKGPHAQNKTF
jgi:hypothetical protein